MTILGAATLGATAFASAVMAATVNGTPGADALRGTRGPDVIRAGGGNDRVDALAGDDEVYGGGGNDVLVLGRGGDRVFPSQGKDTVYGGPGPDVTDGVYFADLGGGRDSFSAGAGRGSCVEVALGTGDDASPRRPDIWNGIGSCIIRGGPGSDQIRWDGTDDPHVPADAHWSRLFGGPGADVISGGYNDDTIFGGSGADELHADEAMGPDRILGGRGDDVLFFDMEPGGSPVNCGPGTDTVHGVQMPRVLRQCEIVNPD